MTRSIVVVGAGSGIGLATAHQLSARGDRLVLVARDEQRLRAVADELPGPAVVAPADITDLDAVERAVAAGVTAYGRVDGLVTSAQPMTYGTVEQVPTEVLQRMTDVAVGGTANLAKAVLPRLRQAGGGSLVVVSSLLAEIAVPSMGAYCSAKWGQLGLVRTLQAEVRREKGLHVSLVLPGAVDTPIYRQAATYTGRACSAPPPVVKPERVAAACVRSLDRPRRATHVGPVNLLAVAGFRGLPMVYDAVSGLMVERVVLRGPRQADHPGSLFEPHGENERLRGGWTVDGRLRLPGARRARWHA